MYSRYWLRLAVRLSLVLVPATLSAQAPVAPQNPPMVGPTLTVPGFAPGSPIKLVIYGDTRFTDPSNTSDTNPKVRQFLVAQIAKERPDALLITGDTPFTGADYRDWLEFRKETQAWRDEHLNIFPTTGNHETRGGYAPGIFNYRANFPQLKGCVYYSAQIGNVYILSLDVTESTAPGSAQRKWLQSQLEHLPSDVDFVFLLDHMPWMADLQTQIAASLPEPSQVSLRDLLEAEAAKLAPKFIVVNGHIHNYERFERNGITYLISGGGGAKAYPVLIRGDEDQYRDPGGKLPPVINFHYIVVQIKGKNASAKMYRVADPKSEDLSVEVRDVFQLDKK